MSSGYNVIWVQSRSGEQYRSLRTLVQAFQSIILGAGMCPVSQGGQRRPRGHRLTILMLGKVFRGSADNESNIGRGRSLG